MWRKLQIIKSFVSYSGLIMSGSTIRSNCFSLQYDVRQQRITTVQTKLLLPHEAAANFRVTMTRRSQKVWRSTPGEVCEELSQAKQLICSARGHVLKWKVWWLDFYLAVLDVGSHHCGATAGIVCSKSLFLQHFQFYFWLVPYLILLTGRSLWPRGVNLAAVLLFTRKSKSSIQLFSPLIVDIGGL